MHPAPACPPAANFTPGRAHARRLREIYRSAGWPCCDATEIELLAAGLAERVRDGRGHETIRVTDAGIALVAAQRGRNRAAFDAHEQLVEQVAREMVRAARVVWRGLSLRAQVPGEGDDAKPVWRIARPDVFSIRNTSVETYVEPVVHEIKVSRADLLGDLRRADKRAAYRAMGECWYVLGRDGRDRPIAQPDEIPPECGVLVVSDGRLEVARAATRPRREALPFDVWMALAKATPLPGADDDSQPGLPVLD
jgi:hypothetical protein